MQMKISSIIGKNYNKFWNYKGRYRVIKGGRGSKKSTTAALWYIYHLLKYPDANLLCVRRYFNSLKDSCYAELKRAALRLGVADRFIFNISPLEIIVKETGQKIIFRGFDNPDSITSITVSHGYLCWVWIEEAYQVDKEEDFNKLDLSIRGIPSHLFPQLTLTLNPWSEMWIKTRFFDADSPKIYADTRNYYHNEFLSEEDYMLFDDIKKNDFERYKVEGLGEWGIPGGRYFNEFMEKTHTIEPFPIDKNVRRYVSFDYGLDMFAAYFYAVDRDIIYVYKEIHEPDLIISEAAELLKSYIEKDEEIYSFYAPPDMWNKRQETGKSVADIFGEHGIILSKASNDRVQGWLCIKEYFKLKKDEAGNVNPGIKIFKNCKNLIRCIMSLERDGKRYNDVSKEPHEITHAPDALRYFIAGQPFANEPKKEKEIFNFDFEKEAQNDDMNIDIL